MLRHVGAIFSAVVSARTVNGLVLGAVNEGTLVLNFPGNVTHVLWEHIPRSG